MKKLAILGPGVVGGSCAEILLRDADLLERNAGEQLERAYVLARRALPDRPYKDKVVTDFSVIEHDADVFLVIETIGGCGAALNFVRRSLEAGKHVMCEKPMAMNYAEAKKMIAARDKSGKVLTIGYQNRYRPDSLYLKGQAEAGMFGDIYYAEAIAVRRRAVPTWGVFIDKEKQGGGPLIDIGTHALDLTLWMMNNYKPKMGGGNVYK